jgi:hypothetical protein
MIRREPPDGVQNLPVAIFRCAGYLVGGSLNQSRGKPSG